jgi:hypothetical protein
MSDEEQEYEVGKQNQSAPWTRFMTEPFGKKSQLCLHKWSQLRGQRELNLSGYAFFLGSTGLVLMISASSAEISCQGKASPLLCNEAGVKAFLVVKWKGYTSAEDTSAVNFLSHLHFPNSIY